MKLMLVDDEPFALRLLAHQCARLGFGDVTTHDDPGAALAALEASPECADMLLLDLQMPGIDGIEFIRHLARLSYRGALAFVSGEDARILHTAQRLAEAHHLQVRGALHKPVSPTALAELLGSTMGGRARTPVHAPAVAGHRYSPDRIAEGIAAGEFVNVYQPKVHIGSGEVVGVETLVRWAHPTDGLVMPSRFIECAEEHGLIDALTRVILRTALAHGRTWHLEGQPLHVAVNISMESLSSLTFPDFVADAARDATFPAQRLVLEVTESRLMRDPVAVLDVLTRIRLKHIGLSIDDFGTGHSSLAQLRDIPFDELKIDRRFVQQAHTDGASRAIVEASLAMARQLGMRSVAEGVELQPQWELLHALGCDVAQGYLIAPPMSAADFGAWLRARPVSELSPRGSSR